MSQTTQAQKPVVEEVEIALIGQPGSDSTPDLRANVDRVMREFDARTVDSFCRVLIERLDADPAAARSLEALIVASLAHPKIAKKHKVQVVAEGRRLAVLLEKEGQVSRAQTLLEALTTSNPDDRELSQELASMMQRTGNADRLIERYLRRAENALAEGRRADAVVWLREVLSIDRSRRDVARMIRDLQYEDAEKRRSARGWLRGLVVLTVLAAAAGGVYWRESWVTERYEAIPPARESDVAALRTRLASLDDLIASNPLWFGAFVASRERSELRGRILELERLQADRELTMESAASERQGRADSARLLGRDRVASGDYAGAIVYFREALDSAPADWEHRQRVEADIAALEEWLRTHPAGGGASR